VDLPLIAGEVANAVIHRDVVRPRVTGYTHPIQTPAIHTADNT